MKELYDIDIIIDNKDSWIWQHLDDLKSSLMKFGDNIRVFSSNNEIKEGEILLILSCNRILSEYDLKKHKSNVVVHESDLPEGKGWSPLTWQVVKNHNTIPITLFEATTDLDSGGWYLKDEINLDGTELIDEIRYKQFKVTKKMINTYLMNYPMPSNKQNGESTYYKKRTLVDQEIDINLPLKDQFNILRVCDNERYPAHFYYKNKKYIIKIYNG